MCNQVNTTGDESFIGKLEQQCLYEFLCAPVSTPFCNSSTGIAFAKLIEDADLTVVLTDAKGCIATDCVRIYAVDARCFAEQFRAESESASQDGR